MAQEKILLKYNVNEYVNKQGELKEAKNFYIEVPGVGIKLQLEPKDYTGREILNMLAENDKLERGE